MFLKLHKPAASLQTALENRASVLRIEQAQEADAAKNFAAASKDALLQSAVAESHAVAVEEAVGILIRAGVTL